MPEPSRGAAYRGLSNGAQEVEIGMAEVVSRNATNRPMDGPVDRTETAEGAAAEQ